MRLAWMRRWQVGLSLDCAWSSGGCVWQCARGLHPGCQVTPARCGMHVCSISCGLAAHNHGAALTGFVVNSSPALPHQTADIDDDATLFAPTDEAFEALLEKLNTNLSTLAASPKLLSGGRGGRGRERGGSLSCTPGCHATQPP